MQEQMNKVVGALDSLKDIARNHPELMEKITDEMIREATSRIHAGPLGNVVGGVLDVLFPDIFTTSLKNVLKNNAFELVGVAATASTPREQLLEAANAFASLKEYARANPQEMEKITDELINEATSHIHIGPLGKIVKVVLDVMFPEIFFDSLKNVLEKNALELAASAVSAQ